MFVYLYKKYVIDGIAGAIQVVEFNNQFDYSFRTLRIDHFYDYYKECKEKKYFLDFEVLEDSDVIVNHEVRTIEITSLDDIPEEKDIKEDKIVSLYELLRDLANCNASYVDDPKKIVPGGLGIFPSFKNLVVAQQTMTVGINIRDDNNNWRFKSIIKIDSETDNLAQIPFYFLIDERKKEEFEKYNLQFYSKVTYNNVGYCLLKYNCDLPICSSTNSLVFCEPLIVHYAYLSNVHKIMISSLKRYLEDYLQFSVPSDATKSVKRTLSCRQGVFFTVKPELKGIRNLAYNLINLSQQILKINRNPTVSQVLDVLESQGYSKDCGYALLKLLEIMRLESRLDQADLCNKSLCDHKQLYLNINLFLYNIRVTCMYNPDILAYYSRFIEFPVYGSIYNSAVQVKII